MFGENNIKAAVDKAIEIGTYTILYLERKSHTDKTLFNMCRDPNLVRNIINKNDHNHDEKVVITSLHRRYCSIITMEKNNQLTTTEADQALSQICLNREDGEKIRALNDLYYPALDKEANKRFDTYLTKTAPEDTPTQDGYSNIIKLGIFAAGGLLTAVTVYNLTSARFTP